MRAPDQLVHSRARLRRRYALFPLEGFPPSKLPSWRDCEARILAAPALGARFAQYLIDIPSRSEFNFEQVDAQEFGYVLTGSIEVNIEGDRKTLSTGGYFFAPEGGHYFTRANEPSRLLLTRKRYEPIGDSRPEPIIGRDSTVSSEPFMGNPHARLQTLLPDTFAYDFAMNIFTFDPGHGLPYVETHVMEHGLLMLEGKGMYYLDGEWMEVEREDFIWMGPFCPQSYYATGPTPTRYIYYKNVNREIGL